MNNTQNWPEISIITVVYNSEKLLERTIQSVLSQTYANIQYIIVDGCSKDHTIDIIKKYEHKISMWISEPDKGLYDAMNKGMEMATGEYVWFMNSGDKIYKPETLEKAIRIQPHADVFYGETMIVDENEKEIGLRRLRPPKKLHWKHFINGMLVCHQSILVKRKIAPKYHWEKYPHSADYDWVLKALRKAEKTINTNQVMSAFLDGGQSKRTIKVSLKERFNIMVKNYGFFSTVFNHMIISLKFFYFLCRFRRL